VHRGQTGECWRTAPVTHFKGRHRVVAPLRGERIHSRRATERELPAEGHRRHDGPSALNEPARIAVLRPQQIRSVTLDYALDHAAGKEGVLFAPWKSPNHALKRACVAAGIAHASWNDLRRTFAQWLRQSGATPDLIAPAMGHTTTAMVQRVYGRPDPGVLGALLRRQMGLPGALQQRRGTLPRKPLKTRRMAPVRLQQGLQQICSRRGGPAGTPWTIRTPPETQKPRIPGAFWWAMTDLNCQPTD